MPDVVLCPLCRAKPKLLNASHPGYQRPEVFAIYDCAFCDLQFAWPMRTDSGIYEHIYRQADRVPGYDHYARLAAGATAAAAPLDWLASEGPAYWFIRDAMRTKLPAPAADASVVEIGSGLGYLTHALALAGYDVTGVDISATAVADATKHFGTRYECADAVDYAKSHPASASAAVMIEVLEHLPDPVSIVSAIYRLLKPGGFALITTPNKSVHRAADYWQTDNPPVHLWWFSETSARRLARLTGFDIELWDFTAYHHPGAEHRHVPSRPMKPPMLDEHGDLIVGDGRTSPARRLKALRDELLPAIKNYKRKRRRQAARQSWADEHGDAIGIVLTKPAA